MKFNKYLLFLILAALMAIVAACGNDEDSAETDTQQATAEAKEKQLL